MPAPPDAPYSATLPPPVWAACDYKVYLYGTRAPATGDAALAASLGPGYPLRAWQTRR
jgi:hypothetical protein